MSASEARNWLGKYLLLTTVILGVYLLFAETSVAPFIGKEDSKELFRVLSPVLLGQVMVVFRFFVASDQLKTDSRPVLPAWVVRLPPLAVFTALAIVIAVAVWSFRVRPEGSIIGAEQFKNTVTFLVAVLNVTTVPVIMKLCRVEGEQSAMAPASPSGGAPAAP